MLEYSTIEIISINESCKKLGVELDSILIDMEKFDEEFSNLNIYFDGHKAKIMMHAISFRWELRDYKFAYDNFYDWLDNLIERLKWAKRYSFLEMELEANQMLYDVFGEIQYLVGIRQAQNISTWVERIR